MRYYKLVFIFFIIIFSSCKKEKIPGTPGAITGPVNFCMGSSDIQYSIAPVDGSSYYLWTVPDDATIASGQGTTSITVNFGKQSGKICVRSNNGSEYSDASCLNVSEGCNVSDKWCRKTDFGGLERYGAIGFSIGSKGYIGIGHDNNGNVFKDFWAFDPSTNVWSQKSDFGGGYRHDASCFSIGNKGYVGSGFDSSSIVKKDFWEYNTASNVWFQKADFFYRAYASGFSIGSVGYFVGGENSGTMYSELWEYDPSSDVWISKAPFIGTLRTHGVAFSIGSKGYFGTGLLSTTYMPTKSFYEYNPSTDVWIPRANVGGSIRGDAVGFSIGSKGYIGFGTNGLGGDTGYNDLWEFNPSTNSWVEKAPLNGIKRANVTSFIIDSVAYIVGGYESNSISSYFFNYKDCWAYRK